MNKQQEKVLIYYIAAILKALGSERARDKFLYDFEKVGDGND